MNNSRLCCTDGWIMCSFSFSFRTSASFCCTKLKKSLKATKQKRFLLFLFLFSVCGRSFGSPRWGGVRLCPVPRSSCDYNWKTQQEILDLEGKKKGQREGPSGSTFSAPFLFLSVFLKLYFIFDELCTIYIHLMITESKHLFWKLDCMVRMQWKFHDFKGLLLTS